MLVDDLRNSFPESNIKNDEPLANYSYTEVGGNADILIFPKNTEEIIDIINWISDIDVPLTILGNASNLIVKEGGIRGITIILTAMNEITVDNERIIAESGSKIIDVSYTAKSAELSGLEFACGIPGSTGGAVFMNAGAYGGEVKDCIESVTLLTRDGEVKVVSNDEMEFTYRNSKIQETGDIVLETTFNLEKGNYKEISSRMDELTMLRTSKQPLEYPSCGSVFKRPKGHYTGKLIQDAGLQGLMWGGAQISEKHAGFIVNKGGATAKDYTDLIHYVQDIIFEKYEVKLETEVRIIGEDID